MSKYSNKSIDFGNHWNLNVIKCRMFFSFRANGEIERLRRLQSSEIEGIQTQLRFAQLRVQSLEQDLKTAKQELEQKVKNFQRKKNEKLYTSFYFLQKRENTELTNICDELLSTNRK